MRREVVGEQHKTCGHGRMSAQVDLDRRSKPSQRRDVVSGYDEGRLGQIVLRGDGLKRLVGKPSIECDDSGWIPAKQPAGECVDLINGKLHLANRASSPPSSSHTSAAA